MKKTSVLIGSLFLVAGLVANAQVPAPVDPGFIQFNNLTVESVSATTAPAEILASNPTIYPVMGGASGGATTSNCYRFDSKAGSNQKAVVCPATTASGGGTTSMPIRYQPYRIEIDASTKLYLRDRTVASLNDFSAGDQMNVFGYYNPDGSIQAYLVRDLSKPVQSEFIQLNNVDLISISSVSSPATLVVAQSQGYPCYGYGAKGIATGAVKQSIVCPMGVSSASSNAAIRNTTVPQAFAPTWMLMRKYVINVDSRTTILDSNHNRLQLSDLQTGDQLNIYGDTNDNGQTLNADIIRDLSIPAIPRTMSGTVTQVNSDGSFVIQTKDGQTITVQNPIQVGATVQITGLFDRLKNVLSRISNIVINGL